MPLKIHQQLECKVTLTIPGYESPIDYLQDQGYLAKAEFHQLDYIIDGDITHVTLSESELTSISEGGEIPKRILDALGNDSRRNIKIVNRIFELIDRGRKTILFSCSVPHARALTAILRYKGVSVGLVTSESDSTSRKKTIQKYKCGELDVLVNYGVLTTGFDAPITSAALISRPTTSLSLYSQMVGRATRGCKVGGNETCEIHTVVDNVIPGFKSMAKAFEHWEDCW